MPNAWFESGLSGRLWPLHLKPYADELLASWLVRLSRAYGMGASRFGARIGRSSAFWNRDVDKGLDDNLLQALIDHTATPPARVLETTFSGYRGFPIPELYAQRRSAWILSIGLRGHRRHRAWLQYCPYCLQDDVDPYFRRHWRFAFVTLCLQHESRLLDRCAACAAPCHIHQLPHDADTMTRCYACQFDARWAQAPGLDHTASHDCMMQIQGLLVEALSQGQYPLTQAKCVATEEVLSVLRHLGHLLIASKRAQELRRWFCAEMGERYFEPSFPSSRSRSIEVLSVADRFVLMLLLAWWFSDWPDQFVTLGVMAKLTVTDFMRHFLNPPEWYRDAVWQVSEGLRFRRAMESVESGEMRQIL